MDRRTVTRELIIGGTIGAVLMALSVAVQHWPHL